MVPTIDVSLIGVLLAIWGAFKAIFSFVSRGLDFIAKKALALLISSKFWACGFFLVVAGGIVVLFYSLLTSASSALPSISTLSSPLRKALILLSYFVRLSSLTRFLRLCLAFLGSYLVITEVSFVFNGLVKLFKIFSSSWKV